MLELEGILVYVFNPLILQIWRQVQRGEGTCSDAQEVGGQAET